jgi:hypothetical protein
MNRLFECRDCPFKDREVPAHESGGWTILESDIPGLAWCKGIVYYKPPFIFHVWPGESLKFGMAYVYPDEVDAMLSYGQCIKLGWIYECIYGQGIEPEWIDPHEF